MSERSEKLRARALALKVLDAHHTWQSCVLSVLETGEVSHEVGLALARVSRALGLAASKARKITQRPMGPS